MHTTPLTNADYYDNPPLAIATEWDAPVLSHGEIVKTKQMVDRAWRRFARSRGIREMSVSDRIHADCEEQRQINKNKQANE